MHDVVQPKDVKGQNEQYGQCGFLNGQRGGQEMSSEKRCNMR